MEEKLKSFILDIIFDDQGITEESWDVLIEYLQEIGDTEFLFLLLNNSMAINGRRCLAIKAKEKIWEALEKEVIAQD